MTQLEREVGGDGFKDSAANVAFHGMRLRGRKSGFPLIRIGSVRSNDSNVPTGYVRGDQHVNDVGNARRAGPGSV